MTTKGKTNPVICQAFICMPRMGEETIFGDLGSSRMMPPRPYVYQAFAVGGSLLSS